MITTTAFLGVGAVTGYKYRPDAPIRGAVGGTILGRTVQAGTRLLAGTEGMEGLGHFAEILFGAPLGLLIMFGGKK